MQAPHLTAFSSASGHEVPTKPAGVSQTPSGMSAAASSALTTLLASCTEVLSAALHQAAASGPPSSEAAAVAGRQTRWRRSCWRRYAARGSSRSSAVDVMARMPMNWGGQSCSAAH